MNRFLDTRVWNLSDLSGMGNGIWWYVHVFVCWACVCVSLYYMCARVLLRYMATTKFEAPYARRAFPCFDEPALKATFNTTLVRRAEYKGRTYNSMSNNELIGNKSL